MSEIKHTPWWAIEGLIIDIRIIDTSDPAAVDALRYWKINDCFKINPFLYLKAKCRLGIPFLFPTTLTKTVGFPPLVFLKSFICET